MGATTRARGRRTATDARPGDALDVVVTMPAYHAEATLEKTINALPDASDYRVLVVDDASTDGTVAIAERLGLEVVVHEQNRGYGGNQKTCYQKALDSGADIVVLLHPDYQYDPSAVPLLIAPLLSGDADMTFGSRFAGMADPRAGGMPWYRFYGNRITTRIQNIVLGTNFSELHSGMRAYTRAFLQSIPFHSYSDDFDFDSKLLADAITTRRRVIEVPIPTRYTRESSSIAIGPSLQYVGRSVRHAVSARLRHGRQGRRHGVVRGREAARSLGATDAVELACIACGHDRHSLVYPSNVPPGTPLDVDEFDCSSNVVAFHDDIIQCDSCGIVRSDWEATDHDIVGAYNQTEDDHYLDQEQGRRELFSWVIDQLEHYATRGRRLVEFGSHLGLFLAVANERGWQGHGVEPSAWAVEEGRRRYSVSLEQGTIERFEPPLDPVDAVVMLDMIEHVPDPIAALRAARRSLADDGVLLLTTIDLESPHARIRKGSWPWFIRPHLWYFTPSSLVDVLDRAGFRAVDYLVVPRDFDLAYVLDKGGENLGVLGRMLRPVTRVVNPRIPTGRLGDIVCVIARPADDA